MQTTWAGLVRVSHLGGRNGDSFHADTEQVATIERYAGAHGANVAMMPPELDISGGLPLEQRPSLLSAVEGVERGDNQGIIVAYLSRLGRSMELLRVWDRVEAAGGRIIAVQESLDTSTPTGRHMRNMLLSQASMERELHAERFETLRRTATEAGIWQRRQTPRGYGKDRPKRGRLIPNEQADEVRWAFRAKAAGKTVLSIADRLGMTPSGVRQLLANRVYLGELKVGEYVNPAAHEPLVTLEEFEAAQRSVARPPRAADSHEPALLAGLARCASCGHLLTRGGRQSFPSYICPTHHSGERCPGPASVSVANLDAFVEPIALAELARLTVTATEGDGVAHAQHDLEAAERELAGYVEAISVEDVGVTAFQAGARKRREAVDGARIALRAEIARRPGMPITGTGADVWESLNGHERNSLLRSLIEAVVVARAGGRGARSPLVDRVRVIAYGTGLSLPGGRGGEARGIIPIALPDLDDPGVLRPAAS